MDKKIILISGGSDGLGKSIAQKLSQNHQVIILSHNLEKLKAVAAEINCDFVQADVTDYSSLESAVATVISKYQGIDVLVNNAGIWVEGQLDQNDAEKIKEVISVNSLGTIFLTKAVLPHMKSSHAGRIVNIVSQDGLGSKKDRSVYSASKWAITGFTKCLLDDLSHEGIGVTAINPGLLKTNLFEKQGVNRNLSNALDPAEVASLVEYVINLSPDTLLPDISIKNINNPTTMNDTNNPIGLDINPDLITPQTGIPQAALGSAPATNPSTGVIDITPGGAGESHEPKTVDITPAGPAESIPESPSPSPASNPATPAPDVTPVTPVAEPTTPVVTPPVESPEVTTLEDVRGSAPHLSELIPGSQPTVDLSSTPPTVSTPTTAPVITETPTPPVTSTTESSTPAVTSTTQVELPPKVENPLSEDPDTVKLVK